MKVLCSFGLLFCLFSSSLSQNYYFFQNKEGAEGTIDCEDEKDSSSDPGAPYIVVDEVKYTFDDCVHDDIYGLREKCDNETSCTFTTSNALVGSSCGTGSSVAGLYIRYHCVRDGAWTSWSGWSSCNQTCGGGYRTKTRTCTNPSPNIFSRNEACMDGRDYETERCNTGVCAYSSTVCVYSTVTIAMDCRAYSTDGKITSTSTSLKVANHCEGITGSHYQGHPLASIFTSCTNDHDCSVDVNRNNYGSCQSYWCSSWSEYDEDGNRDCTGYSYATYSRCSQVYYYYQCTLPQWSVWSSWSSCSVTCGRGVQTRTRSCSTVSTDDAGTFNCEQTGSTHTSETRECLLSGSLPYCTYCGVDKFLYSGIGAMTMNTDSNSGNAILLENNVDIIRCCGRVVSWNVYVKNAGTVTIAVMELTENVDERRIVAFNTFAVINAGNWESYSVPEDEQITIVADNRLLIYDGGDNVVGYATCDSSLTHTISGSTYDYSTNYCPTSTYKMPLSGPPAIGDIIPLNSGTKYINRIYGLQYKTDTNTGPKLGTSELSASIPDHSAVDTSVMSMPFSDTDYADRFTRIVQEDDTYFYLNTKNMTVHVRTTLPHTVGDHEQTHTFYVWVQDTCYNRVTGTVTITTYNEPPYFTGMPKTEEIDEEQTGDLIPFAVVDDNDDPISCSVTSTEPSTSGMFEINNVNYTVSLASSSVLNKDVSASYLVFFECTDGTDTAGSNVTIIVRRNITCEGEHEHYYYYNQTEDQLAELNCSQEIAEYTTYTDFEPPPDPYIVIDEIMYTFWDQRCENTQTYGVVNQCENKTSCSFNVTGATVYSWCGRYLEVIAGLFIRYHCVRDGAWSEWGEWGECSRTCNGGYRRRERNCSNPVPNYFSKAEVCHDDVYFDDEKCNDEPCEYNGTTCRDDTFPAVCNTYNTNGFLTMVSATYTHGCAWNYNTADPAPPDVISTVRGHCDGNNLCPFVVGDTDLSVSCSAMSTYTDSFSYTSQYWCQQSGWYSCEQTVSDSLLRLQTMSYCGKLHWKYLCTVPQWEIWGQWSACTVTCGRGKQTRTRTCLNEVTTTSDGILRTCSQDGSETHSGETRDCLLNGTHPYCTYCGENTYYSYKDVNEMSNTSVVANSFDGNALLFESDYDIIRCCGLIEEWTFFPVATGTIRFLVWRHTTESGNDFNMKVVGFNSYTVSGSDVGNPTTYTPSTTERIAVTSGDRIGVYYPAGNAILGYESCDSTVSASTPEHIHYDKNPCPIGTRFTTIGSTPVVDTVVDWNTTVDREKVNGLQIKTTYNNAPTFIKPSTRWRPDYFTYDDWITNDLVFTDNDYGDFYKRVVAEENELFYLDTGEWRVRFIKSPLHELSTRFHYYNFTVWVEDSCHNRVTGTASIITYNAPPFFNNLAASVNISEHMTSGEVFEVDSEDREGDDYNTDITNTWPTTSIFYFNESRLMLVEGTALDKSILTYIVEVRVRDHNAGRRSNLTIQLIIYPVLQPIYYEYRANEGDIATLTMCNNETEVVTTYNDYVAPLDVFMIIDNVTYILPSFYDCLHNLTYGIRNQCENKTTCTFDVTNEHVTSSCGTDGAAALWIRYHCVRDAAWATWNNWHDCTRSCGGGLRVRYRNCINPSVNYFGSNRSCEDSIDNDWERCNTGVCKRSGDTCRDDYYEPVCDAFYTDGIIDTMTRNHWRDGCAFDFNTVDPIHYLYNVISAQCLNYHNCSVLVDDSLEPCFTDEYQTVNETYVTYKRGSWGWMSYPVTYWRYYTTRVISICGVFRWTHTCKIPQWAQWEQWSGCSQTCDRGYQIRTRVCDPDTISDTIDGYINRCGQFNDETHTLETRECLLAGNHRYCTYCEDRTFIYQDLAALDPVNDTDPGNTVILWSDIDIVRCCGLITSWSFNVMNSGTLKFIVWRSINVDGFYEVVGTNSVNISASDVNKTYTFTPDLADRMVIIAEDLISWYDGGANIIGYDTNCSVEYNASTSSHRDLRPVYCPEKTCKISLDKEPEDKDVFNLTDVNCTMERISTLNYTTTDNTKPYFNLTRVYKTIPDHSTIDFSLMDMYFNDSDYGDWFRNYYPDFTNYFPGFNTSFFYFDSFALTVHVRDLLPHTVGTQNYIHDFIIVAEDSCYNRITGTVTITTFNGPPVFSDLPKKVLVAESKTGAIASFTVEDPSFNDTIACKINRTVPEATGFFFLSGSTVYLNGSATLDRDVADEYEIKIHCSDGTDTTESFLKLEVTEETEDSEEPPEWIVIESVVVLIVTFVGVVVSIGTSYVVMFASTTLVVV